MKDDALLFCWLCGKEAEETYVTIIRDGQEVQVCLECFLNLLTRGKRI